MKQRNKDTAVPHIRKLFWTRLRKEKYLQFMALCGVAWMLVFNYIPMYGILIAFKKNFSCKACKNLFICNFLFALI